MIFRPSNEEFPQTDFDTLAADFGKKPEELQFDISDGVNDAGAAGRVLKVIGELPPANP